MRHFGFLTRFRSPCGTNSLLRRYQTLARLVAWNEAHPFARAAGKRPGMKLLPLDRLLRGEHL
jgi:hypothetical protein